MEALRRQKVVASPSSKREQCSRLDAVPAGSKGGIAVAE